MSWQRRAGEQKDCTVIAFRSLLFSPGSSPRMMEKAKRSTADALIFDLEDAVAPHLRSAARAGVAAALSHPQRPAMFVRVNHPSTGEMEADVDAVVGPNLFGVVLPKAETADDVARLDAVISRHEQRRGVRDGRIVVLPLIESGRGLHFAYDIATASNRVAGLAFSSGEEGDFMADIDGEWTPDGIAMLYPRSKTVSETRAAGLRWSVDGVFMQLGDDEALARECRLSRAVGFQAKMAIHPKQVATIHQVFTPSAEEVARQEAVIAAYREAEAGGLGAVQREGVMIDKANVVRAERILARARARRGGSATHRGSASTAASSAAQATVDVGELERFTQAAFAAAGMSDHDAAAGADVLVRTTLRGVDSHGVSYLHQYIRQLQDGGANPTAQVGTLVDRGALMVLDGDAGLGPAIAAQVTQATIERARTHGVSMATVRNANHFGAAGHYGLMCAEAGCIGLVMSNTPPIMAVSGSRSRSIGNSPLAFGAPRAGGPPFVLDIAMSRVAGGKIRMAIQNGQNVPLGWILDPDGNPTTEPEDFLVKRGALLPMENHKGYGLSLMVETLAGALSGSAMLGAIGNWIYTPESPSDTGYFLMAIDVSDVSQQGSFPGFQDRLRALCDEIVASPRAPTVDRILIPGELEHEAEQRARAEGLALRSEVWLKLEDLAARLDLDGLLRAMTR